MNPLLLRALGSVVRFLLTISIGKYFERWGVWTNAESVEYVAALAVTIAPLLWGLWEKYHSQRKANTTLAVMNALSPELPNITQRDIEAVMQRGNAAPASTSRYDPPILQGEGDGFQRLRDAV